MLSTEQLKEKMKEYLEKAKYDVQKACQNFYTDNLQGKSVITSVHNKTAKVMFDKYGKHKLRDLTHRNKFVEEILPYVPEIITTGTCAGYLDGYKQEFGGHQIFDGFLYFKKKVATSKGLLNVVVDVGVKKQDGSKHEYSFISSADSKYRNKVRLLTQQGIIAESVHDTCDVSLGTLSHSHSGGRITSTATTFSGRFVDVTIPLSFEFVNVRMENIFENALETAYANEFHDNFSDVNYAFGLEL